MITCEYDTYKCRTNAAMARHLMTKHREKWKGTVKGTFSKGYNAGTPEKYKLRANRKKPIKQNCPFCGYKSKHPPGLARHIKSIHPEHWKGNLGSSLGLNPSRSWKKERREKIDELGNKCPVCSNVYKTRSILGHHVRMVHHKSLFDFPPYTNGITTTAVKKEVKPVLKFEWPGDEVVIKMQDGSISLTGTNIRDIAMALGKLTEQVKG